MKLVYTVTTHGSAIKLPQGDRESKYVLKNWDDKTKVIVGYNVIVHKSQYVHLSWYIYKIGHIYYIYFLWTYSNLSTLAFGSEMWFNSWENSSWVKPLYVHLSNKQGNKRNKNTNHLGKHTTTCVLTSKARPVWWVRRLHKQWNMIWQKSKLFNITQLI